jgi:hypothetical protein
MRSDIALLVRPPDASCEKKIESWSGQTEYRRDSLLFCVSEARCVLPEAINTMANKTSPFDHDTIDSAPQFYSRIGSS